jgi:hypothetical protein
MLAPEHLFSPCLYRLPLPKGHHAFILNMVINMARGMHFDCLAAILVIFDVMPLIPMTYNFFMA